jgi:hypothetical protein
MHHPSIGKIGTIEGRRSYTLYHCADCDRSIRDCVAYNYTRAPLWTLNCWRGFHLWKPIRNALYRVSPSLWLLQRCAIQVESTQPWYQLPLSCPRQQRSLLAWNSLTPFDCFCQIRSTLRPTGFIWVSDWLDWSCNSEETAKRGPVNPESKTPFKYNTIFKLLTVRERIFVNIIQLDASNVSSAFTNRALD